MLLWSMLVLTFSLRIRLKHKSTADHYEIQTCQAWIDNCLPCKSFILQPYLCSTNIKQPPTVYFPSTKSLSHQGPTDVAQGEDVKLATGKQTAIVKWHFVVCQNVYLPALTNADVFISPLFPPAVMLLMGVICLTAIS